MKILGLESSALTASVAIMEDEQLVAEYTVNYKKTHSQTLLPMINEIMDMLGMECNEIDIIAVSSGPGSFTGLRIGIATGKGIALATDKAMIAVPTLKALSYNVRECVDSSTLVIPIMDARRESLYCAAYIFSETENEILKSTLLTYKELIGKIQNLISENKLEKIIFVGDGIPLLRNYCEEQKIEFKSKCKWLSGEIAVQKASSVARLALDMARRGEYTDADALVPDYLRPSQAERLRQENNEGKNEGKEV